MKLLITVLLAVLSTGCANLDNRALVEMGAAMMSNRDPAIGSGLQGFFQGVGKGLEKGIQK